MTKAAWDEFEKRRIVIKLTADEAREIDGLVATGRFGSTRELLVRYMMVHGLVDALRGTGAEVDDEAIIAAAAMWYRAEQKGLAIARTHLQTLRVLLNTREARTASGPVQAPRPATDPINGQPALPIDPGAS